MPEFLCKIRTADGDSYNLQTFKTESKARKWLSDVDPILEKIRKHDGFDASEEYGDASPEFEKWYEQGCDLFDDFIQKSGLVDDDLEDELFLASPRHAKIYKKITIMEPLV